MSINLLPTAMLATLLLVGSTISSFAHGAEIASDQTATTADITSSSPTQPSQKFTGKTTPQPTPATMEAEVAPTEIEVVTETPDASVQTSTVEAASLVTPSQEVATETTPEPSLPAPTAEQVPSETAEANAVTAPVAQEPTTAPSTEEKQVVATPTEQTKTEQSSISAYQPYPNSVWGHDYWDRWKTPRRHYLHQRSEARHEARKQRSEWIRQMMGGHHYGFPPSIAAVRDSMDQRQRWHEMNTEARRRWVNPWGATRRDWSRARQYYFDRLHDERMRHFDTLTSTMAPWGPYSYPR